MKKIYLSKEFVKNFKKRIIINHNLLDRYKHRVDMFIANESPPQLKDHTLKGSMFGLRWFSITGDVRVIYKKDDTGYYFLDIGTHNQVY